MSLLEKSHELILNNFIKEKILPFSSKRKDFKNLSLANFVDLNEKNIAFDKCLKLFGEPIVFKPLTFPLNLSINEKINLLKKYLPVDFKFSFIIDYTFNKIKFIYPLSNKKEITLNPVLIKKLAFLKEKEILASIDFLASKKQVKLFKIYSPKNSLAACILYKKKTNLIDTHLNNILKITFT